MQAAKVSFVNVKSSHIQNCFLQAHSAFTPLHQHPLLVQQTASIKHTMQAQPIVNWDIWKKRSRGFRIDISKRVKLETYIQVENLSSQVLTGWFAHELGHLMDYRSRSVSGLLTFGLAYLSLPNYRLGAERRADLFAIEYGMAEYLIATKQYILYESNLPDDYLEKIRKYYMSPEEVAILRAVNR